MQTTNLSATCGSSALAGFNAESFQSYMSKGHNFTIDLAGRSLVSVLEAHQEFQRRKSPNFKNEAVRNNITALQSFLSDQVIMPEDVTDEFYIFFEQYLSSKDRPLKPSTIETYFSTIRSALNWGKGHNCKLSETYSSFKLDNYEKTKIVLTPEQIAHIYYFNIEENKQKIYKLVAEHKIRRFSFTFLQKVKDHFVLSCNIGQRYSDAKRIDPNMFDMSKTIFRTTQQKTGGKACVNMKKYAITKKITFDILNRYNYCAPVTQHIDNYNKILHLLLHAIGDEFLSPVISCNKINGVLITENIPMYKAITSHTARRTFITYGMTHGLTIPQVQKCSGHKDLRALSKYIILDDED